MNSSIQFFVILILFYSISAENGYNYNADLRISYKYHSIPLKWLDAKTICAEENARLVMPKTNSEALAILDIFKQNHATGNPNVTFLDSHEYFENAEFITRDYHLQYFYHSWAQNQPGNSDLEHCLVMDINGKLHDANCESSYEFICQKEDSSKIESWEKSMRSSKIVDDSAYKYDPISGKSFKLHMHQRTWSAARSICHAEGAQLAIIRSKHEENFLVEMFNNPENLWPKAKNYALLGFHDLYRFRQFYTVTDEKLNDVGYVNWAPGQPDNNGSFGEERCGSMTKLGGLNDYSCLHFAQFFCERTNSTF